MDREHSRKYRQAVESRPHQSRRFALRVLTLAALGSTALPATTAGVHGDVPEKVYTYSVNHPTHGSIGTYQNRIVDDGAQVSVRNEIRVLVKVLLVVAHKEATDSQELWQRGRLISFTGVTEENGKKSTVAGEAEGAKFVVETPQGTKEAPADVYPNNPWTKAILEAKVLLGTKSGKLYRVHSRPSEARDIQLGGKTVATEYYRVDGDARYELWFDKRGVPVQFTENAEHGVITFSLVEETVRPVNAAAGKPASPG